MNNELKQFIPPRQIPEGVNDVYEMADGWYTGAVWNPNDERVGIKSGDYIMKNPFGSGYYVFREGKLLSAPAQSSPDIKEGNGTMKQVEDVAATVGIKPNTAMFSAFLQGFAEGRKSSTEGQRWVSVANVIQHTGQAGVIFVLTNGDSVYADKVKEVMIKLLPTPPHPSRGLNAINKRL